MDLIQIAIVDDRQADRRVLADKIADYMREYDLEYGLHEYENAESFLGLLPALDFDIVFMDIYMNGMTGVEAATRLRACDRDCKLVFLTTSEEHLREALSLSSSDYLSKPLEEQDFRRAMANCRVRPEHDVPVLEVVSGRQAVTLDTGRILYIDVAQRVVTIHTREQSLPVGGTFASVTQPLLTDRRFLLCMKGILVNMDKVKELEGDCFRMKNGVLLPVNVRGRKALLDTYQSYLLKRMRGVR